MTRRRPTTTSTHARASARRSASAIAPAVVVVDYQLAFTRGALAGDFPEAALLCDRAHLRRRARSRRTRLLLLLRL